MKSIGVIGAGSWGTALAKLLSNNGHKVTVYSAIASEKNFSFILPTPITVIFILFIPDNL